MPARRLTPLVAALLVLIAAAGVLTIASDRIGEAAVVAGFIPVRLTLDVPVPGLLPAWLTPFSATLVHGGWGHLLFNCMTLAVVGPSTELAVGKRGLAVLWIVGAVASAAAQWAVDPMSAVPVVGASGAISAVLGSYALLFGETRARAIGPIPQRVVHALWLGAAWLALNLLMGFAGAAAGAPIAIAAHVGGFVAGMVLLRPLLRWRWGRGMRRYQGV